MCAYISATSRRFALSDDAHYMNARQVCEFFGGVSFMWIVRRTADADFPPAVKFGGPKSPRYWRREAVEQWAIARAKAA